MIWFIFKFNLRGVKLYLGNGKTFCYKGRAKMIFDFRGGGSTMTPNNRTLGDFGGSKMTPKIGHGGVGGSKMTPKIGVTKSVRAFAFSQ